jgi:hypothetical protein
MAYSLTGATAGTITLDTNNNLTFTGTATSAITFQPRINATTPGTATVTYPGLTGFLQDDNHQSLTRLLNDTSTQTTINNMAVIINSIAGSSSTLHFTVTGGATVVNLVGPNCNAEAVLYHEIHKKEQVRQIIKSNLLIKVKNTRENLPTKYSPQEQKARDTLRDMLTEQEWRRYITNGFIMVRGASGYWYQIFAQYNRRINVYQDNKKINSICIHSDQSCPPTDHVINIKVLVEIDEAIVWQNGNVCLPSSNTYSIPSLKKGSLVEEYQKLKTMHVFETGGTTSVYFANTNLTQLALAC